jgi:hypothetical protein
VDREARALALSAPLPVPRRVEPLALAALLAFGASGAAQTPPAPMPATPPSAAASPQTSAWPPLTFTPPQIERRDPALARLRDRLLAAIRDRRLADVKALFAPTIRDQEDEVPAAEVLESFGPLEAGTPLGEEWQALEQALRLGGIRRGNLYVVPFIEREAPRWKERSERLFIAGRDVPIRGNADPAGTVVARVSHVLLQEAIGVATRAGEPGAECPDWTPVVDAEKMLAWVCTTDTRPVSGLYYAFARLGSGWKLTRIYSIPE